ncbi:MAG: phosphatidylserine decarboxylase [Deltaproteobacteria bacterium]|nr:phosphatidylserine decarboxylase [Deltaproteobacteria bacterium]
MPAAHQYIERESGAIRQERLFNDALVRFLYHPVREKAPLLFRKLTEARLSSWLGFLHFDQALGARVLGNRRFIRESGIDFRECLEPPHSFNTARKVFERRIRYWECRPLPDDPQAVVSPADGRILIGSFRDTSSLHLKDKFFHFDELLGPDQKRWINAFHDGDFCILRLTPDKYHYNHTPVTGVVVDFYELEGDYHSCNPAAVVRMATPYSKNRRVVTVIDTDVQGGSRVGLVAMIEIVALMIGDIVQCYSRERYANPSPIYPSLFLERGCPKSLFRPGSSTDVLIFQQERIRFARDLLENQRRTDVRSRFSTGFGRPLAETELRVRSLIGHPHF